MSIAHHEHDLIASRSGTGRSKDRDGRGSSRKRSSGIAKDAPPLPPTDDLESATNQGAEEMVKSNLQLPLATPNDVEPPSESSESVQPPNTDLLEDNSSANN